MEMKQEPILCYLLFYVLQSWSLIILIKKNYSYTFKAEAAVAVHKLVPTFRDEHQKRESDNL